MRVLSSLAILTAVVAPAYAQDSRAALLMKLYSALCISGSCCAEQIAGAEELYRRFDEWQKEHPERVKLPD